jgi:hypothetical protein
LEVIRVPDVVEWTLSSGQYFYSTTKHIGEQNRLDAMQSERLNASVPVGASNKVHGRAYDKRSRITKQAKARSGPPEELILLGPLILEPAGDFHVERRDRRRPDHKCAQQQRVLADKKRRFLVDRVLNLRLRGDCEGQG